MKSLSDDGIYASGLGSSLGSDNHAKHIAGFKPFTKKLLANQILLFT